MYEMLKGEYAEMMQWLSAYPILLFFYELLTIMICAIGVTACWHIAYDFACDWYHKHVLKSVFTFIAATYCLMFISLMEETYYVLAICYIPILLLIMRVIFFGRIHWSE